MTAHSNVLFASTSANHLPRTTPDWIDESASWQDIHHCDVSAGLAAIDAMLFTRHDPETALANGPSPTAVTMTAVPTRPAPRQPGQCIRQMDGAAFRDSR